MITKTVGLVLGSMLAASAAHGKAFYTQAATTDKVNETATTGYSKADTSVLLPHAMRDTNYAASCSLVGAFGLPSFMSLQKLADRIVVTIGNGPASVASGAAEIDCVITGAK